MYEITVEDWDCIFNIDDPDFENKFTELMRIVLKKYWNSNKKELKVSKENRFI